MATFDVARIEEKIDRTATGSMAVDASMGGIQVKTVMEAMELAKVMATATIGLPKHLRGNPGDILGVLLQANSWGLEPYAVARMSYAVNDILSYQAQLLHALMLKRAPIKGRIKVEYNGEGPDRTCTVWAITREESERVEYTSPKFKDINPKNSPLWKNDPDQQQFYFSIRALGRRHFPDVLLGLYSEDELRDSYIGPEKAKDVTPAKPGLAERLAAKRTTGERGFNAEHVEREADATKAAAGAVIDETATETKPAETSATENGEDRKGGVMETATAGDVGETNASPSEATSDDAAAPKATIPQQQGVATECTATGSPSAPVATTPAQDRTERAQGESAEPGPSQPTPAQIAYQRGQEAKRTGRGPKSMPPGYRKEGRQAEADAWREGFDAADGPQPSFA